MAIPKHILDNCKDFCEKLQKMIDSGNVVDVDNLKKELKSFLDFIVIAILYSKNIKIEDQNRLIDKDYAVFRDIIKDYYSFPSNSNNLYHKFSNYAIRGWLDFDLYASPWNLSYPSYNNLLYWGYMLKYVTHTKNDEIDWKIINTYCKKYNSWLIELSNYINNYKIAFNIISLPFALKYFSISNFQCIKHIEAQLPVDAQFIVFTGENGDGKTSILQALGLGFYNAKDLTDNEKGNVETVISVQYKANENSYHNEIYNNPKYPVLYSLRNNIKELKSFATYGASRLTISEKKDLQNPLLNLITDKAKLYDITESWLRDIAVNEPQKYQEVCDILVSLLPNVSEIRKVNPTKIISDLVFMEKGVAVELKNLSSGHKSIVLMIGDMLMRLAEAQPEITNPKDFAGIVLIDELETHLHPKWQKEFPKILAETFPKVQFIVTTHSAITLLGMPKNTLFFKVKRTEEEGTQIERLDIDVENLLPNQLLTSPLFDMNSIKSTNNKDINTIRLEDNFQEIVKRDEVRKDIAKILSEKFKK